MYTRLESLMILLAYLLRSLAGSIVMPQLWLECLLLLFRDSSHLVIFYYLVISLFAYCISVYVRLSSINHRQSQLIFRDLWLYSISKAFPTHASRYMHFPHTLVGIWSVYDRFARIRVFFSFIEQLVWQKKKLYNYTLDRIQQLSV